jgi:hypothetical protein
MDGDIWCKTPFPVHYYVKNTQNGFESKPFLGSNRHGYLHLIRNKKYFKILRFNCFFSNEFSATGIVFPQR